MILRRVIEHVKAQNWTAVALDFVIVVTGILIAFQITEWSDARSDAKQAHLALERLQAESEEILTYFQELVEDRAEQNDMRKEAIAALHAGSLEGLDRDRVERGLFSLGQYPAITPKKSTHDELTASGLMTRISSPQVRDAIAEYYAALEGIQSQLTFFRSSISVDDEHASSALYYVYAPDDTDLLKRNMDFEALAANPAYVRTATRMFRNQLVFQFYRRSVLRRAEAMCSELSTASGKACAPLSASSPENPPQ